MALEQTSQPFHWAYFLALEDDLNTLSRYVEIAEPNYKTYSIEISRLLLSACAEVDSVLKQLTARIDINAKREKLSHYVNHVTAFAPEFKNFHVNIHRFGLQLRPWDTWTEGRAPLWWTAHTKVKHGRHSDFAEATLGNCINALAALYISIVHLHWEEAKDGLVGIPQLFTIPKELGGGQRWGEKGHSQLFWFRDEDNPFRQGPLLTA